MASPRVFALADCTIDLDRAVVRRGGSAEKSLTRQEVALLAYLADRPGRLVRTDELQSRVLGYAPSTTTAALAVAVRRLRQKIEREPGAPASLLTVRGLGFRLEVVPEEPGSRLFVGRGAEIEALRTSISRRGPTSTA